jgi:hypothetical protein
MVFKFLGMGQINGKIIGPDPWTLKMGGIKQDINRLGYRIYKVIDIAGATDET